MYSYDSVFFKFDIGRYVELIQFSMNDVCCIILIKCNVGTDVDLQTKLNININTSTILNQTIQLAR